jgi:hypothetical protein
MMVLDYTLGCGCQQTCEVAAGDIEESQALDAVRVWCSYCPATQDVYGLQLRIR